jgi:hypothetical protein
LTIAELYLFDGKIVVVKELAVTIDLNVLLQTIAEDSCIRFAGISNKFGNQIAGDIEKS